MNGFLAGTFIYILTVALSVAVMIYGWGLQPLSWWWIIGGGVVGRMLIELFSQIGKLDK